MATSPKSNRKPKPRRPPALRTGRLKAADPFELIRWLARSQPDPRKALAELVQNALDAGARNIRITRLRQAGIGELRILDDGEGVIPELPREEALAYLATHIGHSRKRELTPEQRRELMLQGKYGIGLLGFWSIGRVLEIRSHVPGQQALQLCLHEDSPAYEIDRVRGRLPLGDGAWTEVVVRDLHRQAFANLSARRAADFLGSELRGQLLAHDARVVVHDGVARGRATKTVQVQPRRFEGERLALPASIAVEGFSPIAVELYLLPSGSEDDGKVAVSQAGTVVYEDIVLFDAADFSRAPWNDSRLSGVIDFPDFQVPPGTRRAVIPDDAAAAFVEAMRGLEGMIAEQLVLEQERVRTEVEAGLMRQLERAFREVPRRDPIYDFFEVLSGRGRKLAPGSSDPQGAGNDEDAGAAPEGFVLPDADQTTGAEPDEAQMTIAGPLASATISPDVTKVEKLGERRLRLRAFDGGGTVIGRSLDVAWHMEAPAGELVSTSPATAVFRAGDEPCTAEILAVVREGDLSVEARARVEVVEVLDSGNAGGKGIPEPIFLEDPAGAWRSRVVDERWEVNSGHPDFREATETPRRKLRYLAALLAKEVVLHSFPAPSLAPALERMVEVLTITEKRFERA